MALHCRKDQRSTGSPPHVCTPGLVTSSKTISIKVIDDEEYEKNKTFYLEIGEPRLVEMSEKKGNSLPLGYLTVRSMRKSAVSSLCLGTRCGYDEE
ncbi:hypothetical protein DV515_00003898 [Chloebia gouldiae]|uniref:Calx-beta domain-containing protein n=1 Tax=Chloebia gouldiae TaxID=44316 RepID=A0A3L8SRB0_CHLGU|nr:hypothetical protein DV515_00003898 [Chloebia gouldiae]